MDADCEELDENPLCLEGRSSPKSFLNKKQRQSLREVFDHMDVKGTGTIDIDNLKVIIRALGYEPKKNEVNDLMSEIDEEGTGKMSFDDLVYVVSKKLTDKDTTEEIREAFQFFKEDEDVNISFQSLKYMVEYLGQDATDEELQQMIDGADKDGDGEISEREFVKIIKNKKEAPPLLAGIPRLV